MGMGDADPTTEPLVRWEEFIRLDDDDRRELVDGRLVEIEVPGFRHERIVAQLIRHLGNWVAERAPGHVVLPSGYKIRITDLRGAMPDVQVLEPETVERAEELGMADGRPDLAVEVVSKSSRRYDRVTKLQWYASIGVPEYWIVDPEARTLERLVLQGEHYLIAQSAGEGTFEPESYPGLAIPLDDLWEA